MEFGFAPFLLLFLIAGIALLGLSIWMAQQRSKALAAAAKALGLQFDSSRSRPLAERFESIDELNHGSNRYADNRISGHWCGHVVLGFDYHYETVSHSGKDTTTNHEFFSVFTLALPKSYPDLSIAREGILSKIAQSFGYDDIDFESHEFSRKFCVRSPDKRFAYAFCHSRFIEGMLREKADFTLYVRGSDLSLVWRGRIDPTSIARRFTRLIGIREQLPEYLITAS